ncbi:MAG: DUF4363 family protein [Clostridia bacterium]|nr:DUF4363 family protein [Clostridia bacterium]
MQRALILLTVTVLLGAAAGLWMETSLGGICDDYRSGAEEVRRLVLAGDLSAALQEQAYLHARWQGEVGRLQAMVSHHHTRAVEGALLTLATSLEEGWRRDALLSLDALSEALRDLEDDMRLRWENVL